MAEPLEETITVELSDTDMARFIHFSSVIRYFDVGFRTVLEAANLTFQDLFNRGLGLPVVNVSCDYQAPMQYADRLTIATSIEDLGETTMKLAFSFHDETDAQTAVGSLTAAFYDIERQEATTIPDDVRQELGALAT